MNDKKLSQMMSHALRHRPDLYKLSLDSQGWVALDALIAALIRQRPSWKNLAVTDIERMMRASAKQRYEIQGTRIRAMYGHSIETKIEKLPTIPPETLYHGTSPHVVAAILGEGLKPMRRQYVHLSQDIETATIVGKRHHPQPVLLAVAARAAHEAGIIFYAELNGIWLAEPVPGAFIGRIAPIPIQ